MNNENKYELIKFKDGEFSLDVNVSPNEDTVWLTLEEIGQLFERDRSVIGKHVKTILNNLELNANSVRANFAHTGPDGKTYYVDHYNLDMILAIGYKVNSRRGILFRKWANSILKQYLLKGYVINEERCLNCNSNILSLNNRVTELEGKMKDMKNDIYLENSKAFYEGEIVEPYTFLRHIFFLAKKELIITDYYADNYLISMLKDININIKIITSSNSYLNKVDIPNNINIIYDDNMHGRYIFIDDKYAYVIDNSFNNIGKKRFIIMRLENITKEMLLEDRKKD
ncbi:MAG: virulence RhuM family protein [Acholeplasmatales bacterium]|nr:virulence RhuM family protein [Acholeplasmatales bacterium]